MLCGFSSPASAGLFYFLAGPEIRADSAWSGSIFPVARTFLSAGFRRLFRLCGAAIAPLRRDGGQSLETRDRNVPQTRRLERLRYIITVNGAHLNFWQPGLLLVGTSRCDVTARALAGGTWANERLFAPNIAPLHAARTAQRAVPTFVRN